MLNDIFKDDEGHSSSLRVIWMACVLIIFGVWAIICIRNNQLISFEIGDISLIGLLFGAKIGQKIVEKKQKEKVE